MFYCVAGGIGRKEWPWGIDILEKCLTIDVGRATLLTPIYNVGEYKKSIKKEHQYTMVWNLTKTPIHSVGTINNTTTQEVTPQYTMLENLITQSITRSSGHAI